MLCNAFRCFFYDFPRLFNDSVLFSMLFQCLSMLFQRFPMLVRCVVDAFQWFFHIWCWLANAFSMHFPILVHPFSIRLSMLFNVSSKLFQCFCYNASKTVFNAFQCSPVLLDALSMVFQLLFNAFSMTFNVFVNGCSMLLNDFQSFFNAFYMPFNAFQCLSLLFQSLSMFFQCFPTIFLCIFHAVQCISMFFQ